MSFPNRYAVIFSVEHKMWEFYSEHVCQVQKSVSWSWKPDEWMNHFSYKQVDLVQKQNWTTRFNDPFTVLLKVTAHWRGRFSVNSKIKVIKSSKAISCECVRLLWVGSFWPYAKSFGMETCVKILQKYPICFPLKKEGHMGLEQDEGE